MLNIAKTIYSGWNATQNKFSLYEAEIIPYGTSGNEKKKLNSLTTKFGVIKEHDNIPLPGFTLYKSDRKSWSSVDQTWLVIDPRGFLVRITSENLEKILHVTGITEGLIQEKCVWARENTESKMILVPVSSKTYTEATSNTELIENKIDLKEVGIGDTVLLQNKMTGRYMGVVSMYGGLDDYARDSQYKITSSIRRQILEVVPGKYFHQSDLKILKVLSKSEKEITREESIKALNDIIEDPNSFFSTTYFLPIQPILPYGKKYKFVSAHATTQVDITYEEITKQEAIELVSEPTFRDFSTVCFEDSYKSRYLLDLPYNNKPGALDIRSFKVLKMTNCDLSKCNKITFEGQKRSIWTSSSYKTVSHSVSIDNFTKFYKLVKHVKNQTYI